MKAFLLILLLLILTLPAYAQNFRLTAEFLYPGDSMKAVVELPDLLLNTGKTSDSKYSSVDPVTTASWDHTVRAALSQESANHDYKLDFSYEASSTRPGGKITTIKYSSVFQLTPSRDWICYTSGADPTKGLFRVKIVKIN